MGTNNSTKICKWCAETINSSATVCKHCNRHQNKILHMLGNAPPLISVVMMILAFFSFVEARNERIAASRALQEARNIANNLIKISYIIADGSSRWGGMPQEHLDKIKEYQNEMKQNLEYNIDQRIKEDLDVINKKIEKRSKSNE